MNNEGSGIELQTEALTVQFTRWGERVNALSDISLTLKSGDRALIFGPNGSGKSTLLNAISSQLNSYSGSIRLDGKNLRKYSKIELSSTVFKVNQNPLKGTIPSLSIIENFIIALPSLDFKQEKTNNLIIDMLIEYGLANKINNLAGSLSGGQRQILAMLVAKMRSPKILLLDEPCSALDIKNKEHIQRLIDEINASGTTLVEINHETEKTHFNNIFELRNGRLVK